MTNHTRRHLNFLICHLLILTLQIIYTTAALSNAEGSVTDINAAALKYEQSINKIKAHKLKSLTINYQNQVENTCDSEGFGKHFCSLEKNILIGL